MHLAISAPGSGGRVLETLASIYLAADETDDLRVECYLTHGNERFLGRWLDRLTVQVLPKPRQRAANRMRPARRRFHDVMWTLACLSEEGTEGVVLCQDDLVFEDGWDTKTKKMIASSQEFVATHGRDPERFVIALSLDVLSQHAAECLFISSGLVAELSDAMAEDFENRCPPVDRWLAEWCMSKDIPLLCGVPSVARPHAEPGSADEDEEEPSPEG